MRLVAIQIASQVRRRRLGWYNENRVVESLLWKLWLVNVDLGTMCDEVEIVFLTECGLHAISVLSAVGRAVLGPGLIAMVLRVASPHQRLAACQDIFFRKRGDHEGWLTHDVVP
jgi:hypothetical protein